MSLNKLDELYNIFYEIERDFLRQWSGLNTIEWNSDKMDSFEHGVVMYPVPSP